MNGYQIVSEAVSISKLDTPEKLLTSMKDVKYGFLNRDDKKIHSVDDWEEEDQYVLQSPQQFHRTRTGLCWDRVEYQRYVFENTIKLPFKTFYNDSSRTGPGTNYAHTVLVFERDNTYWLMDTTKDSKSKIKGIHPYVDMNTIYRLLKQDVPELKKFTLYEYDKPRKYGITLRQFLTHIRKSKRIA
jgi:hypothetical protein